MKLQMFLVVLLFALLLADCKPSENSKVTFEGTSFPIAGQLCTSLCLDNGDHCVFGTNMDHGEVKTGQVFVNKRHVLKAGWQSGTSGEYARWISQYGSVTFNLAGYQMVWGGMNEAGLMISTMSLIETEAAAPDERPPLVSAYWAQYQLDNYRTVEEVIASDVLVRPTGAGDHYLVCDRKGDCAVIEFLGGKMVAYRGSSLPVQALTNSTYQDSLAALEDGNYWKVEAGIVSSVGPAVEAGIMEGDWITAVDGVELVGVNSLRTLHSIIAQHDVGDEVSFTVKHPGESAPVAVALQMGPLPEDTSQYILPPDVPIQILSLGFLPTFPGDFLSRFATAVEWVEAFKPTGAGEAADYAFGALKAVSQDDTVLSVVFDPANGRIYFRTSQNPEIRHIYFSELDFSCHRPVMMMGIDDGGAGNVRNNLVQYSHAKVVDQAMDVVAIRQMDVSYLYAETLLSGFESFGCMEDNASALANPAHYVETHPLLLPPLVMWAGRYIFNRFWPVWVSATLLSLAFITWRVRQKRAMPWGRRLVWVVIAVFLGPLSMLAFGLAFWRHRLPMVSTRQKRA